MTEQPVGPRCGNNPNVQLTPGDRKAVEDFKARLALQASAKPYIERAVWVDGDPLMEVIAVTVWERCARNDEDMPQLVCDDPRTIAAFAAAVVRAYTEERATSDRAAAERVRAVLETEAVVGRSALEYRGLIASALLAAETRQPETQAEAPPVCEGFRWIGQSFATCDRCGQPAWDHVGEDVPVEGAGPFDNRRTVRPWKPGQADAIRAKWDPQYAAGARQDGAQT